MVSSKMLQIYELQIRNMNISHINVLTTYNKTKCLQSFVSESTIRESKKMSKMMLFSQNANI